MAPRGERVPDEGARLGGPQRRAAARARARPAAGREPAQIGTDAPGGRGGRAAPRGRRSPGRRLPARRVRAAAAAAQAAGAQAGAEAAARGAGPGRALHGRHASRGEVPRRPLLPRRRHGLYGGGRHLRREVRRRRRLDGPPARRAQGVKARPQGADAPLRRGLGGRREPPEEEEEARRPQTTGRGGGPRRASARRAPGDGDRRVEGHLHGLLARRPAGLAPAPRGRADAARGPAAGRGAGARRLGRPRQVPGVVGSGAGRRGARRGLVSRHDAERVARQVSGRHALRRRGPRAAPGA